ncbi:type IV pilus assembly protein PilM [Desulfosoma caldarium]|uniref:Type IV pilus assembly protein PilM n=1 Tax=Desulfosoma caldarium TaxID=610254 RepID=A0A3N1VLX5_9BACT|nr:type IV pilus assembly protein PilM [Desulfosoma caldarium]ROR03049.1 type IV pilus assembly protein PilM [Desulfosoma caldarium]
MFRKQKALVGVDVGSYAVKMVELAEGKAGHRLVNIGMALIPREAVSEGRIQRPEMVVETLRKLATNLKIKPGPIAASISGYEVMIKKIEMPTMTEEDLGVRLRQEIAQYVPYQLDEVNVDYEILDVSKSRAKFMDVLLVAAKKEAVSAYVAMLRTAGFDPVVIDVDYFALSNAFEATYGIFADENIALMDIGASKTTMTIVQAGRPLFTRDVTFGGYSITHRIAQELETPEDNAERIKLGLGIENVDRARLEKAFVETLTEWTTDVKRALDFFFSHFPEAKLHKIYLSGGSARISGLEKFVEAELGVPSEVCNPLQHLEVDAGRFDASYLEQIGPQMTIGLGLALRRAGDK